MPARSVTPVVIVPVYSDVGFSGLNGVNVATSIEPEEEIDTEPSTLLAVASSRVKVLDVMVE